MDQQFFNLIVSIAGFLAVFVFYQVMQRIQKLEDEDKALRQSLPEKYVAKDDYREDIKEVKDILRQIFDKLDAKQDKTG